MNERARKMARRAELEWALIDAWIEAMSGLSFTQWLENIEEVAWAWGAEAKELIALYEEGDDNDPYRDLI